MKRCNACGAGGLPDDSNYCESCGSSNLESYDMGLQTGDIPDGIMDNIRNLRKEIDILRNKAGVESNGSQITIVISTGKSYCLEISRCSGSDNETPANFYFEEHAVIYKDPSDRRVYIIRDIKGKEVRTPTEIINSPLSSSKPIFMMMRDGQLYIKTDRYDEPDELPYVSIAGVRLEQKKIGQLAFDQEMLVCGYLRIVASKPE